MDCFLQEWVQYMPLKVITYQQETSYGIMENTEYEEELDSYELAGYEYELNEKMKECAPANPRGLMEYYGKHDIVNAKVQKYVFEFEQIGDDMFGVAVLTLNAPLTPEEWSQISDAITGQASDGLGSSFEQRAVNLSDRELFVSLWNAEEWSLTPECEMAGIEPKIEMRGICQ